MGWGTQLAVKVSGIPIGTSCKLWVIGPDGSRTLAGGWVTDDREGTVWYPGSAGCRAAECAASRSRSAAPRRSAHGLSRNAH